MGKLHTHYDNLNVAQNAPFEVIQAAYRALSLKYHPDRNPDNPEAARIMAVVNAAYAVLSDPAKRAEHDAWIVRQEAARPSGQAQPGQAEPGQSQAGQAPPGQAQTNKTHSSQRPWATSATADKSAQTVRSLRPFVRKYWFLFVVAALLTWKLWYQSATPPSVPSQNQQEQARKTQPATKRVAPKRELPTPSPVLAPLEPEQPGAVTAPLSARCRVVVDNRQGHAALVARLVRLGEGRAEVVREFSIPASGTVNVRNVEPGTYEVRYRNPATGVTMKTDPFTLHEARTAEGVRSDVMTLTTYTVPDGNMRTTPIREGEY
ncbi:MAG: J domain-containing protein [Humidesulfovibrio sp.]|nr:J domain-containing protein [Humidesulfovibrio sp.]